MPTEVLTKDTDNLDPKELLRTLVCAVTIVFGCQRSDRNQNSLDTINDIIGDE